jgi:hypothetical protein
MNIEQSDSMFTGEPRKLELDDRGERLKRLIEELNLPFARELIDAFLNTTDPRSWLVGEMGWVGNVIDEKVWASMRIYRINQVVYLDIYNRTIKELKNLGFLDRADGWYDNDFYPGLRITAGPHESSWSSDRGDGMRYGVSMKFEESERGLRFPDSFNQWLLRFASKLSLEYAKGYEGHYTDQPEFYPATESNPDLELFDKTRQIYAVKRRNRN